MLFPLECFGLDGSSDKVEGFFQRIIELTLQPSAGARELTRRERELYLTFVRNCFASLEHELVRSNCLRYVSPVPLLHKHDRTLTVFSALRADSPACRCGSRCPLHCARSSSPRCRASPSSGAISRSSPAKPRLRPPLPLPHRHLRQRSLLPSASEPSRPRAAPQPMATLLLLRRRRRHCRTISRGSCCILATSSRG